ncbi:MAG: hypothetical protein JXQ87_10640 [Bacteroidia bacterium]
MLRISLLFIAITAFFGFKTEFENRQDALDYLNNANIWIGGMPEFRLDESNRMLNVILKSEQGSVVANIPLDKITTELKTEKLITVELNCKNGTYCATANSGDELAETDGLTLVMSSTFDDGTYRDKYIEQGAKVANAIDYLASFYKE